MSDFQWIFDKAETISVNKRAVVAQSITRGNRVKSSKLGGQTWRFDVKLPDGMLWSTIRSDIEKMEYLDRYTAANVSISHAGMSYINQYLGNSGNIVVKYLSDTNPTTLTITSANAVSAGQYFFKAGDWLQLGTTGHCYSVAADVPYGANTVTVNRPVIETANVTTTYTTRVGQAAEFNVICVEMPSWTIFARDQVSWSGNFIFYEVV